MIPDFRKGIVSFEASQASPVGLSDVTNYSDRENPKLSDRTSSNATLPTINLTWTNSGLNSGIFFIMSEEFSFYCTGNNSVCIIQTDQVVLLK
jgi:hypothetical protein